MMIQITISDDTLLADYIKARASESGTAVEQSAQEIIEENFLTLVRTLHELFMRGEFSQGHMAEQLGISRLELIHLLDKSGLQVTNL